MIVVTSRIRVTGGDADALAAQYRRRSHLVESMPGCRGVEILRHADRPEEFLVYTRWDDQAAYDHYRAAPEFREAHRKVREIAGGIRVERVEEGVDRWEELK